MSRYTGDMSNGPWELAIRRLLSHRAASPGVTTNYASYLATPITIALPLHCHLLNCGRVESLPGLARTGWMICPTHVTAG